MRRNSVEYCFRGYWYGFSGLWARISGGTSPDFRKCRYGFPKCTCTYFPRVAQSHERLCSGAHPSRKYLAGGGICTPPPRHLVVNRYNSNDLTHVPSTIVCKRTFVFNTSHSHRPTARSYCRNVRTRCHFDRMLVYLLPLLLEH